MHRVFPNVEPSRDLVLTVYQLVRFGGDLDLRSPEHQTALKADHGDYSANSRHRDVCRDAAPGLRQGRTLVGTPDSEAV